MSGRGILYGMLLVLVGCQSMEKLEVDCLQPADIFFPANFRTVGVVNNTPIDLYDGFITDNTPYKKAGGEISYLTAYAGGDAIKATQALADAIAEQGYFDKVVICDSVLPRNHSGNYHGHLTQREVNRLTRDLDVDCVIALEDLELVANKSIVFQRELHCFQGVIEVIVYPTVRVYLPHRTEPFANVQPIDTICWEGYFDDMQSARMFHIPDEEIVEEASLYGGTLPVKNLIPHWVNADRYIYVNGSTALRDGAVHLRHGDWDLAYNQWQELYKKSTKPKQKMMAAYNIAVYHEMQDSLTLSMKWVETMMEHAKTVDKVNKHVKDPSAFGKPASHLLMGKEYLEVLRRREEKLQSLKQQMRRFEYNQ